MKKQGYTLAEVLITIAVIGIVAALTLPTLNMNITRHQAGPLLAKAINNLEHTNKMILQQFNARHLGEVADSLGVGLYPQILLRAGVLDVEQTDNPEVLTFDNQPFLDTEGEAEEDVRSNWLLVNDGIAYGNDFINGMEPTGTNAGAQVEGLSRKYFGTYYPLLIDVNGSKGPNILGMDVFSVFVDWKGSVIPFGGREYAEYMDLGVLWQNDCNGNVTGNGQACAGAIADNGYRVNYSFELVNRPE